MVCWLVLSLSERLQTEQQMSPETSQSHHLLIGATGADGLTFLSHLLKKQLGLA